MQLKNNRAQSVLEYAILLVVVMGALLTISNYIKRGVQGRWRQSVDDVGAQYDPRAGNSLVRHTLISETNTEIRAEEDATRGGTVTKRTDTSKSTDKKEGFMSTGAY